jgi:hypothetical protein
VVIERSVFPMSNKAGSKRLSSVLSIPQSPSVNLFIMEGLYLLALIARNESKPSGQMLDLVPAAALVRRGLERRGEITSLRRPAISVPV